MFKNSETQALGQSALRIAALSGKRALMSPRHDLVEAYQAWKRAVDEHQVAVRAIMDGSVLNAGAMQYALADLDVLHERWMDLAMRHAVRPS